MRDMQSTHSFQIIFPLRNFQSFLFSLNGQIWPFLITQEENHTWHLKCTLPIKSGTNYQLWPSPVALEMWRATGQLEVKNLSALSTVMIRFITSNSLQVILDRSTHRPIKTSGAGSFNRYHKTEHMSKSLLQGVLEKVTCQRWGFPINSQ